MIQRNQNQQNSPLNHKLALALSVGFSLLISFFVFSKSFFDEHHKNFYDNHIETPIGIHYIIAHFLIGFITFYLSYQFCFWIFRKKWKNSRGLQDKTVMKSKVFAGLIRYPLNYYLALLGMFAAAMLISVVLSIVSFPFLPEISPSMSHVEGALHFQMGEIALKRGFAIALIVFLSTYAISSFVRNQQVLVENQRLVAENIRNRHEALKNQLNPHFLFNSLNTLDGLIGYDDDKAHQYLLNLSSTFRYTIQNKEITTLLDELNFVESYVYLMKIRYGDNLKIQYAVDEKYNLYYIMPVSLQMLMENAIKHNVINDRFPLTIHIETTEQDTIRVSNAIQPKIDAEAGEGIGLANLVERYHLLLNKEINPLTEVAITKTDIFAVEIPLIKEYASSNN